MSTYKILRSENLIKSALSKEFSSGRVYDIFLLEKQFTFSNVKLSRDMKIAKCYVTSYQQDKLSEIDKIVELLNANQKIIRYNLSPKLNFKYSPEFKFFRDLNLENKFAVDKLLIKISQQRIQKESKKIIN